MNQPQLLGLHENPIRKRLIELRPPRCHSFKDKLQSAAARPLERLLSLDRINQVYDACRDTTDPTEFLRRTLEFLNVRFQIERSELDRVPRTGPLVIVANHPFGALDGIVLAAVLRSVRPDVKVMVNHFLGQIDELRELFFLVDPFGGPSAAAANLKGVRQSVRWLEEGHALAAFPAGEVASLNLRDLRVVEKPWMVSIARIIRRTNAPVLPVYFRGRNSFAFQAAGLLHPRLRTALLAREVFNKNGHRIQACIGSVIPSRRLQSIENDSDLAAHLRQRTLLLRHRLPSVPVRQVRPVTNRMPEEIIPPVDPVAMAQEIALLPMDCLKSESDNYRVMLAGASAIPNVLREIGRLRELTFRATGEGTGKSSDHDRFDQTYHHLFVWNAVKSEIVGAYRIGFTDQLLTSQGKEGLYTSTLFDFDDDLLKRINPSLELGRSFIRQEYQRAYSPLLLLWKAVGAICVRDPRYKTLIGPVSISNDYQTVSKQLLVRFLQSNFLLPAGLGSARARQPFRIDPRNTADLAMQDVGEEDISAVISDWEPDQKGIPILIRQYLKLGAKLLAFNVDPDFNDCVDGLILVDLTGTEPKVLHRYMTRPGYEAFMAAQPRTQSPDCL